MPVSSVSDFERFAQKVIQRIGIKVKKIEDDASANALQQEEEAVRELQGWLQQASTEWEQELHARKLRGYRAIADEVNRQWSAYKKERETALKAALKVRLEQIFPTLAECFIGWVTRNYGTGTFTMPKAYMASVNPEMFDVRVCEDEQIIFRRGHLYIEYSVERIIEELSDEIAYYLRFEEDAWQA